MAEALTIGLNPAVAGAVRSYFQRFSLLPPNDLRVTSTTVLGGPNSFERLLTGMKASRATDFVVVVHGHEDGSGLYLRLAHRRGGPYGPHTTHDKLQRLMTIAQRTPARIDETDRQVLGIHDTDIQQLLGLMNDLRAKRIGTVEFRGCNLGRDPTSLSRFRAFLGARRFGAPNLHSFFGDNVVGTGAHQMTTHERTHRGTTYTYTTTYRDPGGTLHCCIGVNDERKPVNGHLVADAESVVVRWIRENLSAQAGEAGRTVPVHGLWEFPRIDLDDSDPLAGVDAIPRPIFPLARNGEYRRHVVYSTGPAAATR